MMKLVLMGFLLSCVSAADASELIFKQEMDVPYGQNWYAGHADSLGQNSFHIYVRGEGKLGDFYGILYLDCNQAEFSRWDAVGGNIEKADVPNEAIAGIRFSFC
ncbi:hypothetical protein ASD8599_03255 [Ascidiaceihabitans donghaensis]|uniref:Beta/gamma crystallin 'Greek key' domain-containing protein n=1 Tax=Ascidiaceihabitans donghaensis TaxID=1510460 RepID=A0A2R8BHA2_9RHOB|nr:hypothetical protein [Ascidiaceihabitans donghaensis]SPH22511.1 hypothetical protein ASD8599_03255 [Ascidiaceihabitans donghaensis]